jgi:protein PhnA
MPDTEPTLLVRDSNGTQLLEGDTVTVIKDLKVKGATSNIKRGTTYKNIHLTENPAEVECGSGRNTMVLRTEFLKKAQN